MVNKVIDEAKSEVTEQREKDEKLGRERYTEPIQHWKGDTINGELDCRWVQMTWNRKQRLEKLWVEFRTTEERETRTVRIYSMCTIWSHYCTFINNSGTL